MHLEKPIRKIRKITRRSFSNFIIIKAVNNYNVCAERTISRQTFAKSRANTSGINFGPEFPTLAKFSHGAARVFLSGNRLSVGYFVETRSRGARHTCRRVIRRRYRGSRCSLHSRVTCDPRESSAVLHPELEQDFAVERRKRMLAMVGGFPGPSHHGGRVPASVI